MSLYSFRVTGSYEPESMFEYDVKLTESQKDSCEGELQIKECGQVVKYMSNTKSPGSDGFTLEFYKKKME